MKLLIIDFNAILKTLNTENLTTKTFEIFYDIARLLDAEINQESCFKLYVKYRSNYGKLKDYICILGKNPDKLKFDEEFYRRFKQLYFNQTNQILEAKKQYIQNYFNTMSQSHIIAFTGTGHMNFLKYTVTFFDIAKFFNTVKISEYLNNYPQFIKEIFAENIIPSNSPEKITFVLDEAQSEVREHIEEMDESHTYSVEIISPEQSGLIWNEQ